MNSDSKSKEKRIGSIALAEDIMQRLEHLGIKRNEKFATMYDAIDGVIILAEFYKLAYKNAARKMKKIITSALILFFLAGTAQATDLLAPGENVPGLYEQQLKYRGRLSSNPYHPDSTSNPYGRYGSPYSPDSINNPYGLGSKYHPNSPKNPYGQGLLIYEE